jgi:C1A family cysteine protease
MLKLVAVVSAMCSAMPSFEEWASMNGKVYEPTERDYRNSVYDANVAKILEHNAGNKSWTMNVNKFADLTGEEFKARFTGGIRIPKKSLRASLVADGPWNVTANPTSVDWEAKGAVTPIKNQQQCGSCWAFSAICAIEGQYAVKTKNLLSLSE